MATEYKQEPTVQQGGVTEPVTYQQPAPQATPSYKVVTGDMEWKNDMFSCFDGGLEANDHLCLKATFCPWFVYGKQQERLRNPSLQGYDRINNDCLMFAGAQYVCGLSWVLQFIKRGELRQAYNIKGDQMTDCLYSCLCHCCVLIQHDKEIVARQVEAGQSQGYAAPKAMEAHPQ